ncbi:MAG: Oxidoreductase FAD-binding domain protein [Pseudonocardiales bacterium]|nr:Oxidoreductase FAD-binding domain protein [Pseudonocardiales bacterium]
MTEPVPAASAPAGGWRKAVVREVLHPTKSGYVLRVEVIDRVDHWAGQHYVIRLTAEDGYTASRSYSVASAPSDSLVEFFFERLEDGEVSGYLADVVAPGDELDVRGPIGGWFTWRADGPAVAVGGGTGIVPIVSMIRQAASVGRPELIRVAASARTLADLPYAAELTTAGALIALSREAGVGGRVAGRLLADELGPLLVPDATYFVCGSAPFAETVSRQLVDLGVPEQTIRVERFGASS